MPKKQTELPPGVEPMNRTARLLVLLFIVSIIFAFYLISFDEMIKAFIGIAIINGWFFTILILHLQGKILFLDDIEAMQKEQREKTEREEAEQEARSEAGQSPDAVGCQATLQRQSESP